MGQIISRGLRQLLVDININININPGQQRTEHPPTSAEVPPPPTTAEVPPPAPTYLPPQSQNSYTQNPSEEPIEMDSDEDVFRLNRARPFMDQSFNQTGSILRQLLTADNMDQQMDPVIDLPAQHFVASPSPPQFEPVAPTPSRYSRKTKASERGFVNKAKRSKPLNRKY